ncbi:MAG: hypothetical protein HRU70_00330 [Phycisphaeraceae bacterium]|nr:MAG: hypothetical protein HRU70_00330 [Phycisphaeraceae bacterium]
MKKRSRDGRCICAVAGLALALAAPAMAQSVTINFEGNSLGGLHGQSGPGGEWLWVLGAEQVNPEVVSNRVSPIGGGSRAVRYNANSGSSRIGVNLGQNFTSGVVKVQWDFWTDPGAAQGSYRLVLFNTDLAPESNPPTTNWPGQLYMGGAGGQYNLGGWLSQSGGGPSFNDNVLTRSSAAGACEGKWYRVAYYFDLDEPNAPLIYTELFDIDNGQLTRIAERRENDGSITFNNTIASNNIRSFCLRAPGSQNENFYLDNITFAAVPGFTPPVPAIPLNDPGDPAPTDRPAARDAVVETAVLEVDLGSPIGEMPSVSLVGSTLWMLDDFFGLQSWDTVSRPGSATFVDGAFNIVFSTNPTSVMVPSSDNSRLYVWANTIGLGSINTAGWRDLAAYDIASGSWSMLVDGDVFGNTGDHGIARATVGGTEVVYSAWLGASQYTGMNPAAGTTAPAITGVGNRWAGALTEGRTADEMFVLAHTDAAGNRLNGLTGQVYQGLYRTTWVPGCVNPSAVLRRLSASAQVVPWQLNCPDGGCVNRASMQYVPATNTLWLVRAANTNEIGVYDLDTDTWGLVQVNAPDGSPMNLENADLQLVGDRMFIYAQGYSIVVSVDATIDAQAGCPADFNDDGFLDFFDLDAYVACFEGDGCPDGKDADYNNDDFIDFFDLDAYLADFELGC